MRSAIAIAAVVGSIAACTAFSSKDDSNGADAGAEPADAKAVNDATPASDGAITTGPSRCGNVAFSDNFEGLGDAVQRGWTDRFVSPNGGTTPVFANGSSSNDGGVFHVQLPGITTERGYLIKAHQIPTCQDWTYRLKFRAHLTPEEASNVVAGPRLSAQLSGLDAGADNLHDHVGVGVAFQSGFALIDFGSDACEQLPANTCGPSTRLRRRSRSGPAGMPTTSP